MKKYVLDVLSGFLAVLWVFFAVGAIALAFKTDFGLDLAFWFQNAFGVNNRNFINFSQISLIILAAVIALILVNNDDSVFVKSIRSQKGK
jgi:hypothetical protein